MLLDIYMGKDRGYRCGASIGAISAAASLSIDLSNGVHLGGVQEIPLSEERIEALRLDRALVQLFLSEGGVEPVIALWIVCINVFDAVPGEYSMPIAVLPARECLLIFDRELVHSVSRLPGPLFVVRPFRL
jgi:hypothetical protein